MEIDRKTEKAVKAYIRKLPPELKSRYGGSGNGPYTSAQVERTITDLGLSTEHIDYALLLFVEGEAAEAILESKPEVANGLFNMLHKLSDSGFADGTAAPDHWAGLGGLADFAGGGDGGDGGGD